MAIKIKELKEAVEQKESEELVAKATKLGIDVKKFDTDFKEVKKSEGEKSSIKEKNEVSSEGEKEAEEKFNSKKFMEEFKEDFMDGLREVVGENSSSKEEKKETLKVSI